MKVRFPRGLVFDLDHIPEDFEAQIQQAFHDYTNGTRKEYMYQDKLCFIDVMVNLLHGKCDNGALVDEWLAEYAEHERKENGYFISKDDAFSWDSMVSMVDVGRKQQSLYGEYTEKGSHEDEKIMKLLVRAIKAVMDYGEETPEQKESPKSKVERMFGAKEDWHKNEPQPALLQEQDEKPDGYKGFLLIRCRHCGQIKAFCAKVPIIEYFCKDCGCTTPLDRMIPAYVRCKCGSRYKYRSNIDTGEPVSISCLQCSAPIDLEFNKKKVVLETL